MDEAELRANLSHPDIAVREAAARDLEASLPDSSSAFGGDWEGFIPELSARVPDGWFVKESVTILRSEGDANVIFSSEPIGADIGSAAYAEAQREILREEFPGFAQLRFERTIVFGRDGYRMIFEWRPVDGDPVTQIQLYHASNGRGFTATATVLSNDFDRRRPMILGILGELRIEADRAAPAGSGGDPDTAEFSAVRPDPAAALPSVAPRRAVPPPPPSPAPAPSPPSAGRPAADPRPPYPSAGSRRFGFGWRRKGRGEAPDAGSAPEEPPPPPAAAAAPRPVTGVGRRRPDGQMVTPGATGDHARCQTQVAIGDPIDCTVFGPDRVARGGLAFIQVFAHLEEQAADAAALAAEFDASATRRGMSRLSAHVRSGQRIEFELRIPGIDVIDARQELTWSQRAEAVQFDFSVPDDLERDIVIATVVISLDSVPIGQVKCRFAVDSDPGSAAYAERGEDATAYRRAFISYASPDRDQVLGYAQLLHAVGVDYFQDVLTLEPGARWEQRLQDTIPESDLFLLFWSTRARESDWVRREVELALAAQGGSADLKPPQIRPVILEGPPPPEPWPELAHLHFNDPLLYFRGTV